MLLYIYYYLATIKRKYEQDPNSVNELLVTRENIDDLIDELANKPKLDITYVNILKLIKINLAKLVINPNQKVPILILSRVFRSLLTQLPGNCISSFIDPLTLNNFTDKIDFETINFNDI